MKTKSEELFETFLNLNNLSFQKIEEVLVKGARRPDYLVEVGKSQVMFEVKELTEDDSFKQEGIASTCKVGEHVRRLIGSSKKQVQYGANQGIPSVLLIYNSLDSMCQEFGTSNVDFTSAMYGEITLLINKETRERTDLFNGKNDALQKSKNTSFSAVGKLTDKYWKRDDKVIQELRVTLFENAFAKMDLPFDELPPCIVVHRFEVSKDPMSFS